MPYFGAHMSIAGGLYKAAEAAAALGMGAVQIFTHSPSQWAFMPQVPVEIVKQAKKNGLVKDRGPWRAKELPGEEARQFRQALKAAKIKISIAHDSYLINLASPQENLYRQSVEAFVGEIRRAEALGISYLVTHPGAATDGAVEGGLGRVAAALDEIHARCPNCKVRILLETTAGQGTSLGHRFEHLAAIINQVQAPQRLGVCLDTCHVFAAGYPLAPETDYQATMAEFDRVVGLKKLKAFHLNDSKKPQGSRVDRHEHLGKGHLGLEPFRLLVNDPRFAKHPMVLETPKEGPDGMRMDPVNLATLDGLLI